MENNREGVGSEARGSKDVCMSRGGREKNGGRGKYGRER